MGNPPGLYLLGIDANNNLTITPDGSGTPITDFSFVAPSGTTSIFRFEIQFDNTFGSPPVHWRNIAVGNPNSIQPQIVDDETLDLAVTPSGQSTSNEEFHFIFDFSNPGPNQGDPTIVEKPPE